MAIDFSEVGSWENWELFARDLLIQLGFVIEVGPGRGADQGKDMIVSEQLRANIATKKFVWLALLFQTFDMKRNSHSSSIG
jgi:hypothetical protein